MTSQYIGVAKQRNGAILVYQTIPPGIKLYFYAQSTLALANQYDHWSREWKHV